MADSSSISTANSSKGSTTRAAVLHDAGPDVPEVPIDDFVRIFLPKIPETDMNGTTVAAIVEQVTLRSRAYARRRWVAFPRDPANSPKSEQEVFEGLVKVVEAIESAARRCNRKLKPTTRYITRPSNAPSTAHRHNKTRPDGYFVRNNSFSDRRKVPHWLDIAITGEVKKNDAPEDIYDDVKKVLWNMHHTLREDARRRYAFAFTIENRTTRLWRSSRSEILVSSPFDFMQDTDSFVAFVLAFLYAPPEPEMGWDPTMKIIWNGNMKVTPQYQIKVRSRKTPHQERTFQTVRLISGMGAEAIRGRGTRVWEVKEVVKGKLSSNTFVLKDSWIDSNRQREGQTLEKIKEEAFEMADESLGAILLSALLTLVVDGDVFLDDGTPDQTMDVDVHAQWVKTNINRFSLRKASTSGSSGTPWDVKIAMGDLRDQGLSRTHDVVITYAAKTHYRVVFEEVCEVLRELTRLEDIIWAVMRACQALAVLHSLGWVHRDISTGNILVFGEGVKLADFEYAKRIDTSNEVHDVRTGTQDFMSIEVHRREFLFTGRDEAPEYAPRQGSRIQTLTDVSKSTRTRKAAVGQNLLTSVKTEELPVWTYNPLHDVESILWLVGNTFLNKDVICKPLVKPLPEVEHVFLFKEETEDQRCTRILRHFNYARTLFGNRTGRVEFLTVEKSLTRHLGRYPLHPALAPIGTTLERMRRILVDRYREVERDPASKINPHCADGIHVAFCQELDDVLTHIYNTRLDIHVNSLAAAAQGLPASYKLQLEGGIPSSSNKKKRTREDLDPGDCGESEAPRSKSPRVDTPQSPQPSPLPAPVPPDAAALPPSRGIRTGRPAATRSSRTNPASAATPAPTRALRPRIHKSIETKLPPRPSDPTPPVLGRPRRAPDQTNNQTDPSGPGTNTTRSKAKRGGRKPF